MTKTRQINLIPAELLKKSLLETARELFYKDRKLRNIFMIITAALFIVFMQITAIGIMRLSLKFYNHRIKTARMKLNRLQSQSLQLEKQKNEAVKEGGVRKERLDQLLSGSYNDKNYSELLEFIAGLAPGELWIKQLEVIDREILIAGTTLDPQMIIQFMDQLDESGAFRDSFFSSSEKEVIDSHAVYNFQVTTVPVWEALKSNLGSSKNEG